jgi:hypothetical protein
MRCLYCGKELALLKRWTGGGEFCSDAHRLRYQEEYNQLALNRLLQAKPPANETPQEAEPKSEKPLLVAEPTPHIVEQTVEPASLKISEGTRTKPVHYETPSPAEYHPADAPVEIAAEASLLPISESKKETVTIDEPAPAKPAGFIVEMPLVALAEIAELSRPDLELLESAEAAALPSHSFASSTCETAHLETAGLVNLELSHGASNYTGSGSRERRLELREFVRAAPIITIDLSPATESLLDTSSDAVDFQISPQPPLASPTFWLEPAVEFSNPVLELGALARLSFPTTGFANHEEASLEQTEQAAPQLHDPPVQVAAEVFPELTEEIPDVGEPAIEQEPAPTVELPVMESSLPAVEEPEVVLAEQPVEEVVVEQIPEPPAPLPDLVTRPLPLSLQAVAPGKGKPVQIFSSAPNAVEPQVPRSTSLPLRPVMTFGPAPAPLKSEAKTEAKIEAKSEAKPEAKAEPKKPAAAPVRPDPRVATGRIRSLNLEVPDDIKTVAKPAAAEPVKEALKQVAKAEAPSAPKPPAKPDTKQDKKQEAKLKDDVKPATGLPTPLAAPFPGTSDLGLPRLNLQSSPGFLQLPPVAKIGIVVVLLAGLGALIAFSSKGGSAAVKGVGTVVEGSALPAGEAGWITDWGADPGVRRSRQISILRSSQTLTDYRIEMQAQIESKAIGWVFRAADPKNFYVTKLEIVKPGLEPTVALVRFAIINGEEQAHAQLPLPIKARLDTMYKIRFDAVGDHFTTFVQDEKVDDWTDDHIKTGGVGFYRERGEDATLKGGMSVIPLMIRK